MSQPPPIPPRPTRTRNRGNPTAPEIPPRPTRRFDRPASPSADRFAPSPLNEALLAPKSPKATHLSIDSHADDASDEHVQRPPGSVTMPSLGEEGAEYAAIQHAQTAQSSPSPDPASPPSPGQTRTVAQDLHLHAPKPSFPAQTAKERVQAVTATDSEKAAAFGIGRPSSEDLPPIRGSLKKQSNMSQASEPESVFEDEEHGIPEIGQRVPMNPDLGDVQAPSPAPPSGSADDARSHTPRGHNRRLSAGGFSSVPPGSYGLHGHGTPQPTDKLQKAWYEKNPESFERESARSLHDRQTDYAMNSTELNKLVHETRDSALGTPAAHIGTPTEEVGYQAADEYTQRIASPPGSSQPKSPELRRVESAQQDSPGPDADSLAQQTEHDDNDIIHVDAPQDHHQYYPKHASEGNVTHGEEAYNAPILASDEVAKDPDHPGWQPAVPPERRPSVQNEEDAGRTPSRPTSTQLGSAQSDLNPTPLEDVQEYEPLFPENEEVETKEEEDAANTWKPRHKFPSKDVWEDVPESANVTAVVSTPERPEDVPKPKKIDEDRAETPAQAFARRQEALAEKESRESENFVRRTSAPIQHDPIPRIKDQEARPGAPNRFPSRDVWEDAPESSMQQTTVDTPEEPPQETQAQAPAPEPAPKPAPEPAPASVSAPAPAPAPTKPQVPARPQRRPALGEKPVVPERPRPRQTPSDEKVKPSISDRPKPPIPARPTRTLPFGADSNKEQDSAPKPRPAVPPRPLGSKIQALQAGFMSDLNKRLQLGPKLPAKKEEPPAADMVEEKKEEEEKERAPLVDARKGRVRGPQRRLPTARSPAPAAAVAASTGPPTLGFSEIKMSWSIDDDGNLEVNTTSDPCETKDAPQEAAPAPETVAEPTADAVPEPEKPESEDVESEKVEPQKIESEKTELEVERETVEPAKPESENPEPEMSQPDTVEPEKIDAPNPEPEATESMSSETPAESSEIQKLAAADEQPEETVEDIKPEQVGSEKPQGEVKTLASNMAGESVVEVKTREGPDDVNPVAVKETGGEAE